MRIRLQLVIQKPFCELLNVKLFKRQTSTPPEMLCKKDVLKASQSSKKNTCAGVYISISENFLKSDSSTGVSL